MQTFVPSSNVIENARVLDRLRVGKQLAINRCSGPLRSCLLQSCDE